MSQPANFWRHETTAIADQFTVFTPFNIEPTPPSNTEVETNIQPALSAAVGELVRTVVDAGYTITVRDYGYGYYFELVEGGQKYGQKYATYRLHLTIYIEYTTNIPRLVMGIDDLFIILFVILIAGLIAWRIANNLTTKTTVNEQYGWVQNPNTGIWEFVVISRKTDTGPPDWWAYIIPIIALGGIVLLFPSLITGLRGAFEKKREQPLRDKQGRILW